MKLGIGLPNTMAFETDRRLMLDWARLADEGPFGTLSVLDRLVYDSYEPFTALNDISLDIEAGLNVLRTDSHKLQRIISNLLENSFRHSPPDSPLEVRIRRTAGPNGDPAAPTRMVELAVLDRGSGIPPELAEWPVLRDNAVAAARRDGLDPAVTGTPVAYTVDVPGGRLVITERPDGEIEKTGPAVIVAEGEIDADWLAAAVAAA